MNKLDRLFVRPADKTILTKRETEILDRMTRCWGNKRIADDLFIDVKTVEHHINSAYSKIRANFSCADLHMRTVAVRFFLSWRIGQERKEK